MKLLADQPHCSWRATGACVSTARKNFPMVIDVTRAFRVTLLLVLGMCVCGCRCSRLLVAGSLRPQDDLEMVEFAASSAAEIRHGYDSMRRVDVWVQLPPEVLSSPSEATPSDAGDKTGRLYAIWWAETDYPDRTLLFSYVSTKVPNPHEAALTLQRPGATSPEERGVVEGDFMDSPIWSVRLRLVKKLLKREDLCPTSCIFLFYGDREVGELRFDTAAPLLLRFKPKEPQSRTTWAYTVEPLNVEAEWFGAIAGRKRLRRVKIPAKEFIESFASVFVR